MGAGKSNVQQMVCKVRCGKSIKGALNYNENKVKEGKAECIGAVNFIGAAHHMTFYDKLARFQNLIEGNTRAKTNTLHISLNFDVGEKLNQNKLNQIATTYMDKIGFGGQPYLVYQHHDAAHPHVHIVTTNIQDDGRRIRTHNLGKNQSEGARKEIEVEFGLIKAQSKPKQDVDFLQKAVDKAVYGKSETKKTIDSIVDMVMRNYNCTSLIEFNTVLRQFNVMADRGKEGTTMYQTNGLLYWILDNQGNKIGVPIKASALVSRPTMKRLQSKFQANERLRQIYKGRLTDVIDSFFHATDRPTRMNFCDYLNSNGINPVFRENKDGRVYGITYVDNRKGAVINGSDLGKAYSGQALVKRFNLPSATGRTAGERERQERVGQWMETPQRGSNERSEVNCLQNISQPFLDLMKAEKLYAEPATPMFKRRRKKKRGMSS
jgi:hypothetical protein